MISQVLCRKVGGGRVAGFEIMVTTHSIASLIRENKTYRIASDIQTGSKYGMISLDAHLTSLVNRGLILPDQAIEKSQSPVEMRKRFKDQGLDVAADVDENLMA